MEKEGSMHNMLHLNKHTSIYIVKHLMCSGRLHTQMSQNKYEI